MASSFPLLEALTVKVSNAQSSNIKELLLSVNQENILTFSNHITLTLLQSADDNYDQINISDGLVVGKVIIR